MNDNKSPNTSLLAGQANKPLSAPPIDVTSPAPNPVSPSPKESQNSPIAQPEIPSPAITEHEITPQASTPGEALIPSTETEPILQPTYVPPPMPSTTPSTPTTSSIPPMPSIEPPVATTVISGTSPNPAPAPITPLSPTNSATPTIAIDSSAAIPLSTSSNSPEATTTLEPATQATNDALPPKKPKALVFIVILLALVGLTLGGLVVWRAMQPKTSSIDELITPPVVIEAEDIEEITEEEVIVEQPVDLIEGNLDEDSEINSATSGAALQGSCTQDGETYADGDEVPAPDSCNSCSCENGQIACTAMACEE